MAAPPIWRALAALVLALGLGACASAPSRALNALVAPAGASLPDPCGLLTPAEVNAALGQPTQAPLGEHEMLDAECSYTPLDASSDRSVLVELTAAGPESATFEQRAQFFQREGGLPIGGVGAAAYAKRGSVLSQKPGVIVFVILTDNQRDEPTVAAAAQNLTRKVLARLP